MSFKSRILKNFNKMTSSN